MSSYPGIRNFPLPGVLHSFRRFSKPADGMADGPVPATLPMVKYRSMKTHSARKTAVLGIIGAATAALVTAAVHRWKRKTRIRSAAAADSSAATKRGTGAAPQGTSAKGQQNTP